MPVYIFPFPSPLQEKVLNQVHNPGIQIMQIPRLFSHCYGMPTLAKPVRCTCFHKLSYCNSALSCKVRDWAHTHTLGRLYPNSSSGQSTIKLCWCRERRPTGGRGTPSALPSFFLKKPLLLRESTSIFQKREQQLAEVHNLFPYSQPREGCMCKALNHQQRK